MDIEYAKFIESPKFVHKRQSELDQSDYEHLISKYRDFELELAKNAKTRHELYNKEIAAFDKKVCFCGSPLRYIRSYDFWGCSNYKNKEIEHVTFSGHTPNIISSYVNVNAHWLSDIIRTAELTDKISAKKFYEYLMANGYEDLRVKYGHTPTTNTLNALVKAKQRSFVQEEKALRHLQSIYTTVVAQQCIEYKIKDRAKSLCIPDFICFDKALNEVHVIDAKLDFANDDKMNLYVCLVSFILQQHNDTRTVWGLHLFYKDSGYRIESDFPYLEI